MAEVPCPTCQRPVAWNSASRWRPFCSDRCRLIDLGEWLSEKHAIPGEPANDESDGGSARGSRDDAEADPGR